MRRPKNQQTFSSLVKIKRQGAKECACVSIRGEYNQQPQGGEELNPNSLIAIFFANRLTGCQNPLYIGLAA